MNKRNRSLWIRCALVLALALIYSTQASAILIPLNATIDGPQANAGAGTGAIGTGSAAVTLDTNTNVLSWNVSWSGLTGAAIFAHFHGPALPNQNAGAQVDIGAISGLVSPSIGNSLIAAGQANDLLAGLYYINIHTGAFPGGEIRGQVSRVPEPSTAILLVSGIFGLLAFARRRRRK